MTCKACTGTCREGKDCPSSVYASRAAIGLPPPKGGGNYHPHLHRVTEQEDEPVVTPEEAAKTAMRVGLIAYIVLVLCCTAGACLNATLCKLF